MKLQIIYALMYLVVGALAAIAFTVGVNIMFDHKVLGIIAISVGGYILIVGTQAYFEAAFNYINTGEVPQ